MINRLMGLSFETNAAKPRSMRYYKFIVPGWSDIHDRVIDEAAAEHLGVGVAVNRHASPVELFVCEPPELFLAPPYEVRRWQMLTALLVNPDLAGRWKAWLETTLDSTWSRSMPGDMVMRIITKEEFERQVMILETWSASAGLPSTVLNAKRIAGLS